MPKMAAETTSWKVSDMHSAVELVSVKCQITENGLSSYQALLGVMEVSVCYYNAVHYVYHIQ